MTGSRLDTRLPCHAMLATALLASAAMAQQPRQTDMPQVVVTGTVVPTPKRQVDTAYSLTTASEEQIREAQPTSTADLLKMSPGVYAETTGGQTGNNIELRGFPSSADAPYVTVQLNGAPLYPAPTISFLANATLLRLDDTLDHAEILRGGPGVILSNGQPGATMNLLLKQGGDQPEGSVRVTTGSGALRRVDAFYGGKLAPGWYGTIGGFYRRSNGVRDPGFPADDGGALTATLSHRDADGSITLYVRHTGDNNAFYTNIPVLLTPGGAVTAFPGVDPLRWTPMSNAIRYFTLPDGTRGDLAGGRGTHGTMLGLDAAYHLAGWQLDDKLGMINSSQPTVAMFGGPSPTSLDAELRALVAAANANPALVAAAGRPATGGSAVYAGAAAGQNGAPDAATQTVGVALWDVAKRVRGISNDLRLSKTVAGTHTLTLGAYLAWYATDDAWNLGNTLLMDMQRRPIIVTLDNGVHASDAQGFISACTFCIAERGSTRNAALYVADEWHPAPRWTLDAGARQEWQGMNLSYRAPQAVALAGSDPLAAYNYNVTRAGDSALQYRPSWAMPSLTMGALYKLHDDASLYLRLSKGGQFPFFDQVRGSIADNPPPLTKINQAELGYKLAAPRYSAYVALYANTFADQFQSTDTFAGVPVNTVGGSRTYGVEYELALRPGANFQLALRGHAQRARYRDYDDAISPGINGRMVQRQPPSQWRIAPSYRIPLGANTLRLYASYTRVHARYDDQQNTDWLPGYGLVDGGSLLTLGKQLELRLSATNLTRQVGLTSGNAGRALPVAGALPFAAIATPQFDRAVEFALLYRF